MKEEEREGLEPTIQEKTTFWIMLKHEGLLTDTCCLFISMLCAYLHTGQHMYMYLLIGIVLSFS